MREEETVMRPAETALIRWIRALEGMEERLRAGARVAEVRCGNGTTAILLARTFTASTVHGFDPHPAAVDAARLAAARAGVSDRVTFEVASAEGLPGRDYDLMGVFTWQGWMRGSAAAERVRDALVPEGAWLLEASRGRERSLRVAMSRAGFDRVRHVGETETTAVFEIRRS